MTSPARSLAAIALAGACSSEPEETNAATEVTNPTSTTAPPTETTPSSSSDEPSTDEPTTDDPDEPSTDGPEASEASKDSDVCAALGQLRDADDETTAKVNEAMEQLLTTDPADATDADTDDAVAETKRIISEIDRDEVDRVYDDLAAAVPEAQQADVETMHEGTNVILDALSTIDIADQAAMEEAFNDPVVFDTARASLALDRFSRAECDIVIAD